MPLIPFMLCAAVALALPAQPDPDSPMYQDGERIRWISHAVHMYAQNHDGQIPPDLASVVDLMPGKDGPTAEVIRKHFIVPGIPSKEVPKDAQASWVNENSSYAYLGKPNVGLEDAGPWSEVAIACLKLNEGHPAINAPNDREQQLFTITFLDGHTVLMPRRAAAEVVESSKALLDALSAGTALPERYQLVFDMRAVGEAILAYSKAHEGDLPRDLGATLAFVKETKRTKTPAQRAAIYLSPRVKANMHVPDEPTVEWVNRNTSFVYLGAAGVKLSAIEDPQRALLLHIRPEDATPPRPDGSGAEEFPVLNVWGSVDRANRAYYDWVIAYTKQIVESARTGAPLPDVALALRDLRLIHKAIEQYAKAHDGTLPADLGQTLDFLPKETFAKATAQEKARTYLSPRDSRVTQPPEDADAAWVKAHASYKYLGDAGLNWKDIQRAVGFVILHAPVNEELTIMQYNIDKPYRVVPAANSFGGVWTFLAEPFQQEIDRAKEEVRKIKAHEKDE
jgi:hypothetical protein